MTDYDVDAPPGWEPTGAELGAAAYRYVPADGVEVDVWVGPTPGRDDDHRVGVTVHDADADVARRDYQVTVRERDRDAGAVAERFMRAVTDRLDAAGDESAHAAVVDVADGFDQRRGFAAHFGG